MPSWWVFSQERAISVMLTLCRGVHVSLSPACLDLVVERDAMQLHVILRWCVLAVIAGGMVSCQLPDRYLIYPRDVPPQVQTWTEDVDKGALRLHLEWARPGGAGPFPTVLVHPDGSATAADMRGVIWDLASRGYLAVAADYRRLREGIYRRTVASVARSRYSCHKR